MDLTLVDDDGTELGVATVNLMHLISISRYKLKTEEESFASLLVFTGQDNTAVVKETPEEIKAKIQSFQRQQQILAR